MCGRFTILTLDQVMEVIQEVEAREAARCHDDWPELQQDATPGSQLHVIAKAADVLQPVQMTWGYQVSWSRKLVFNTRAERAFDSYGMWTDSFAAGRCIVPARAFFEPHRTQTVPSPGTGRPVKAQYRFAGEGAPYMLLAGVFSGDRFSVVTTAPDKVVGEVHDRMPLLLSAETAHTWLSDDYRSAIGAYRAKLSSQLESDNGIQLSLL